MKKTYYCSHGTPYVTAAPACMLDTSDTEGRHPQPIRQYRRQPNRGRHAGRILSLARKLSDRRGRHPKQSIHHHTGPRPGPS